MCVTTLRSRMAIIPQDPTLFAASVRYNVDPTDIYADEDIWEALQMVCLGLMVAGSGLPRPPPPLPPC